MSHEGIRIVREDEMRQDEREARPLPPEATRPAKVRIELQEGTGVAIEWRDGHASRWSFRYLRDACPCATCHEEREATGRRAGDPKPAPATAFPIFKAPALPLEAIPVGRYAVKFRWNDGHESGIYSWDYLRRLDGDR